MITQSIIKDKIRNDGCIILSIPKSDLQWTHIVVGGFITAHYIGIA